MKYTKKVKKIVHYFLKKSVDLYNKMWYHISNLLYLAERSSERKEIAMIHVVKKDNTKEEFNVQKVVNAVNKSACRVMYSFTTE